MRPSGCNLSPDTGFIEGNFMDEAQDMPPAEPDEDAQLMLRVRNGDASAMEMLVRKHQNSVYATVARMLNNGPEVEDIAQQVFIRIWKGAGNYEASARFTTWMFTILRNLVFNEVRRQKRKPTTSADAMEEEGGMTVFLEPSQAPDEAMEHTELQRAVDEAIAALPEKARLAVQLRRFENMPYEEIVRTLEMTVPATKSLLFRARNMLKDALASFLE